MNLRRIYVLLLLLLVCFSQLAQAQGFRVESDDAPSLRATDKFVSESGRFSIALPERHSFQPITFDTDAGKATGDAYTWVMKEGHFIVIYADFSRILDQPDQIKAMLDGGRDSLMAVAAKHGGSLVGDVDITLNSIPGRELRVKYADSFYIDRVYLSGQRVYQVMVTLKAGATAEEALAVKTLDSFKVLSASPKRDAKGESSDQFDNERSSPTLTNLTLKGIGLSRWLPSGSQRTAALTTNLQALTTGPSAITSRAVSRPDFGTDQAFLSYNPQP